MKIYVASSWRNPHYPEVVYALRGAEHDVYDFRNPEPGNHGFSWRELDPGWQSWSRERFREMLEHPVATHGAGLDPAGRSAHLEFGHALGAGKRGLIYLPEPQEPELMYGLAHGISLTIDELLAAVGVRQIVTA